MKICGHQIKWLMFLSHWQGGGLAEDCGGAAALDGDQEERDLVIHLPVLIKLLLNNIVYICMCVLYHGLFNLYKLFPNCS